VNWSLFWDLTVSGLTLGSVYSLIALGYSMVYGILKLLNFAHGDVYMIGAFVWYFTLQGLGGPLQPSVTVWLVVSLMFLASMLGGGLLGVVIERFAYRPLRDAPRIAPLISALGVSFFLQNAALLVARTKIGKAMRATSFDREAASMMGIDVDRVIASTFFIGSALAGAAGVMFGLVFGQIFHYMGFLAGLKGFTAAVIGGIGSIPGAMLGGLLVGLAEAYSTGYLPQGSTFQNLYVFALLILIILIKPSGILVKADVKKV